jgi:VWFA-related protein
MLAPAQTLAPGEVRLSSRPYQPGLNLRLESRLVQLEVVVRDRQGRAISGLKMADFAVYDAGTKRDLTGFIVDRYIAPAAASPGGVTTTPEAAPQPSSSSPILPGQNSANGRSIGLLFDDINTTTGDLAHAKIAANRFIREAVRSGDRIAVFTTSGIGAAEFASDSAAILASVAMVRSHPRTSPGGLAQCPRMTAYEAYEILNRNPTVMQAKVREACQCSGAAVCGVGDITPTSLFDPTSRLHDPETIDIVESQARQTWDQTRLASQVTLDAIKSSLEQLARRPAKRMLLLASAGFLSGTLDEQQDAIITLAVRAGVVINALDAKGLYAEAPGPPINESLETSELPLGSTIFQIQSLGERLDELDSAAARFTESTGGLLFRNNNDLDLGFRQLGLLPSCTYLLGFPPAEDGKYHKIKVELRNASHDFVQVRPGYFAPGKGSSMQPSPTEKLDALMSGTGEKTDLPATISEKVGTSSSGGPQLTIQAHVDIQKLSFEQQKDRHVQKLTFVAALFDPQNNFITGKQADMELALKPESFDHFSKTGINGAMQLEVPPGTYRLRVVVQESLHGALSATTKTLQIP